MTRLGCFETTPQLTSLRQTADKQSQKAPPESYKFGNLAPKHNRPLLLLVLKDKMLGSSSAIKPSVILALLLVSFLIVSPMAVQARGAGGGGGGGGGGERERRSRRIFGGRGPEVCPRSCSCPCISLPAFFLVGSDSRKSCVVQMTGCADLLFFRWLLRKLMFLRCTATPREDERA